MQLSLAAALFLILGVSSVVADPVHVHLNFTCHLLQDHYNETHWCGYLTVYEHDTISSHDLLKSDEFCGPKQEWRLQYDLYPGGDLTPNYEINYVLTHNCTSTYTTKCVHPKEPKDAQRSGESTVEFNLDLYDVGADGACKPL